MIASSPMVVLKTPPDHGGFLRFGAYELDTNSGELRKGGKRLRLQPQPARLLTILASDSGRLISREELRHQIWDGTTFVDFEQGLNFCIRQIRAVLNDKAARPRFIETVPRRGYRFIASVEVVSLPAVARFPRASSTAAESGRPTIFASPRSLTSIAVLPFVFLSEVEESKALSLGFADALITIFGNLEEVAVAPTSAILNYDPGTEPARVCRDLGVRFILQGNVQKLGPQWRVSMQLFDATAQKITLSEKHDFRMENVFDVKDEIGRQVVESLQSRIPLTVRNSRDRYSTDPEAYNEFMAGFRESYSNRHETLESAVSHLSRAVERDPEFALAHAWLSHVSMQIYFYWDAQRVMLEKAEHHCYRALALDPALPEAHWARAAILWSPSKNFQHVDAIAALERVLAARPNFDRAHNLMAAICWHIGRFQEARVAHDQAMRSNPRNRTYNLEHVYLYSGEFAHAEEAGESWLREAPGHRSALSYFAQPPLMTGNLDLAEQRLEVALKQHANEPMIVSLQGMLHARRNQVGPALECVQRALDSPRTFGHTHHTYYQVACVYAVLGSIDKAMAWLERTVDTGFPCWPFFMLDPHLENLHQEPEFQRLVAELEQKYTALEIHRL